MKILTSKVCEGRIDVPEGTLHEGETVTLLVPERDDDAFTVTDEERESLLDSLAQARRGEGVDGWALLDEIRR